jgi:hypothetical protein
LSIATLSGTCLASSPRTSAADSGGSASRDWGRVLERHREGLATLEGWCWLDVPGKLRHVPTHDFEFRDDPPMRLTHLRVREVSANDDS